MSRHFVTWSQLRGCVVQSHVTLDIETINQDILVVNLLHTIKTKNAY